MNNSNILSLYDSEKNLLNDVFKFFNEFHSDIDVYRNSMVDLLHKTKEGNYELKINVAGYKKEEIKIVLDNHHVFITAENKTFGKKKYRTKINSEELDFSTAKSRLEDGILYITFSPINRKDTKRTLMIE
jgi:HSP20 family molecular chaperone IbpA